MSDADDTIRSENGVVVCLRDMGNGTSKLILDDVRGDSQANPISWSFECFYAWRDFSDEDLDQMKLGEREYQMIGENLVARLLALNGRLKPDRTADTEQHAGPERG